MTAGLFFLKLANLTAGQQAALRDMATRPLAADVIAHDAFTAVYWGSPFRRDSTRIVAGLYFWHPKPNGSGHLPQALAKIPRGRDGDTRNESLLKDILAAPLVGLPPLLFEAVRRLRADRVPVDWPQLLVDLAKWDRPYAGDTTSIQDDWANCWLDSTTTVSGRP